MNYTISGGDAPVIQIGSADRHFSTREVEAVWYRKIWAMQMPPDADPAFHRVMNNEYHTMRNIFFDALRHVPWINHPQTDRQIADNKFLQLEAARNAGLEIPKTLFSNRQEDAVKFFHVCGGQIITKMHGTLSYGMSGGGPSFPTSAIAEEDLEQLDTLHLCPMIFQERVPRKLELRIAWVEGRCFTGAIDTSASLVSTTDWRHATDVKAVWQHYELPATVQEGLTRMMRGFCLSFGAIDMIVTPDGRHVFLEVNPQGEWGMLQRDLDLPIGEAIADQLISFINSKKS